MSDLIVSISVRKANGLGQVVSDQFTIGESVARKLHTPEQPSQVGKGFLDEMEEAKQRQNEFRECRDAWRVVGSVLCERVQALTRQLK